MKANLSSSRQRALPALLALAALCGQPGFAPGSRGNPPAPYNLLYGVVRDKYGTPLTSASGRIVLETPGGAVVSTAVMPGYAPGVNYQLKVPMDSGDTPDLYRWNALTASAPYKLYVVLNGVTNLPIEMTVNYATLGQPGKSARIDLTLGVDSNGDGIPDAWENAFLASLAAMGINPPLLSQLNPNGIYTADGLTLRQQYLFGTYPFNPSQPCLATFAGFKGGSPELLFPTITGRYYSVLASADAEHWNTVSFYLPTDSQSGPARTYYYAPGVATAEVYVVPPGNGVKTQFYRILVQQ